MKYCRKCGGQLEDYMPFCPYCGAPQQSQQAGPQQMQQGQQFQAAPQQGQQSQQYQAAPKQAPQAQMPPQQFQQPQAVSPQGKPAKPVKAVKDASGKKKKIVPIIIIAAVVLLLIGGTLLLLLSQRGAKSYQEAVENYINAVSKGDAKGIVKTMFPADVERKFNKAAKKGEIDGFKDRTLQQYIRKYIGGEDYYGKELRDVKIVSKDKYGNSDIDDMTADFTDYTNDSFVVTSAYLLQVDMQYKSGSDWEDATCFITVYETGGKWYIIP